MKVAIVHDYLKEFGGAERVLKEISDLYPDAPIYTAFCVKNSIAGKEFKNKKIIESWLSPILKIGKLYSPLRFLAPVIWGSFDLSKYDLVITSCSWYITRGFKVGKNTKVVAYCHTPPRWLYGYDTSVGFTKYWPVKVYAAIVGHFMRIFDYKSAQEVNYWIANSNEVKSRIQKFYQKDATVIYPPIDVEKIEALTKDIKKEDFYFIASRQVGAKGIDEAIKIFTKLNKKLYIAGEGKGFYTENENIKFLGRITDEELFKTYARAKAFVALARDEDFGMTPVEAHAAGAPTIAYYGGGFKETVKESINGVFVNEVTQSELRKAIEKIENKTWNRKEIIATAKKFSKDRFKKEMLEFVNAKKKL